MRPSLTEEMLESSLGAGLRGVFFQQQTALEMGGVGKLVEQGAGRDVVAGGESLDVVAQGMRIARNVENVGESGGQRQSGRVEPAARRVDE